MTLQKKKEKKMTQYAIGIDASLLHPAICRIPLDWDCDMKRVEVAHLDTSDREWKELSEKERFRCKLDAAKFVSHQIYLGDSAAIESLPTRDAFNLVELAKLHGIVEYMLYPDKLVTVNQSSARRLFMGKTKRTKTADGKIKKGDMKKQVIAVVRSLQGAANWTGDECDAFVIANYLASELGAPCMMASW